MRLISCHIENFGIIKNSDYTFNGDLTVFCEENGYGKTTLASFLKAMFYGMDSDRTNSKFNDRRHFYPFAGGKFGGSVTFESDGANYKIERFFDVKSEPNDTLTVYRNGRVISRDWNPGQKFFGIDRESFERTAYISGADVKILSTGNINKKLNNFVEGDLNDLDYEAAKSRLTAKIKQYQKTRGEGGLIYTEAQKVSEISAQISDKKNIEKNLVKNYEALETINGEISELNECINEAQSNNVILANWESYDRMNAEFEECNSKLRAIENQFPFGIPLQSEVERVKKTLENRKTDIALLSQKSFTNEDEVRYSELNRKYSEGISDDLIREIREKIDEEKQFGFHFQTLNSSELTDEEKALMQKFAYRVPSEKDITNIEQKVEQYKAEEKQCKDIPEIVASGVIPADINSKSAKKSLLLATIFAAALMVAGIGIAFFNIIVGIVLLSFGIVILLVAGFVYLNKKAGLHSEVIQNENPEKRKIQSHISALYTELQAALLPYGYSFENGAPYAVASFLDDIKKYTVLCERIESSKSMTEDMNLQWRELKAKIESFFAKYGIVSGSYDNRLAILQSEFDEYIKLKNRRGNWAKQEEQIQQNIDEQSEIIRAFCQKYKVSMESINAEIQIIEQNISEYSRLKDEISDRKNKAENFKTDKKLSERPVGDMTDIKELNEQLSQLQDKKATIVKQILGDENEIENIDILQSEYAEARERLEKYKENYAILLKTYDFLQNADKSLKDKYVKPVKDSFMRYSESLEKVIGEKIIINADFELRYESDGAEHSDEHLSSGQRSLCALCFRLALIDNMYPSQKPFIILDDPFMSLDEEHLSKAKELLRDLAKNMQLIYFTCHSSRTV